MEELATAVLRFIAPDGGGRIGKFTPQGLSMVVSGHLSVLGFAAFDELVCV